MPAGGGMMGNLTEFERYLDHLCEVLGHVDRSTGLKDYCRGLMLPIGRKRRTAGGLF